MPDNAKHEGAKPGGPATAPKITPSAVPSSVSRAPEASGGPRATPADPGSSQGAGARGGAGFGSLLAASVLGGLIGAGLMVAYDAYRGGEEDLTPRLAQLEQRVAQRPPLEPLEQRLAQVEGAQKSAQGGIDAARALAQQAIDRPAPASTPASEANAKAIQELGTRVTGLEGGVQSANEAAKALEGRLAEGQRTLGASVQQATERATRAAQAMQRVAAAERVADAIRTGAPYPQALDILRRSGADAQRVDAVAPFAGSGAPTAAALAADFKPVAERVAIASRTPPAARDAGGGGGNDWTSGVLRLADRLVTVRPTGEAAPDEVKAALDRVEAALRGGDLRGALKAYDALPEAAKKASQDFGQRLRTRVAAEEAARTMAGDALAGLDAPAR
ncbi:COG4223 family protein [Salinarimonas soli]|nr:hypothetical protein [Salinarimonas soli]